MVQCAADVADYSFVWIHVAEPTSQPPTNAGGNGGSHAVRTNRYEV